MSKTHEMVALVPKPDSQEIARLLTEYFNARAKDYDEFDTTVEKRNLYRKSINQLIAKDLASLPRLDGLLSIACGPGGREMEIRDASKRDYAVTGVDISPEMCELARQKGIRAICGSWPMDGWSGESSFDSVTLLYSFGLLPDREVRDRAMAAISSALRVGGRLYIDFLNIDDESEWGPEIKKWFLEKDLGKWGYEQGDVFYRKIGSLETSFFHYFSLNEIKQVLSHAGLSIVSIHRIGFGTQYGEILEESDRRGAFFVIAEKV